MQVVAQLTGSPDAGTWRSEALDQAGGASATVGLFRVSGDGWSVVLKLVGLDHEGHPDWRAGEQPEHWYYWRREALAYESGLLASFTGGLRAPTCYLIAERTDGSVALWLEDLGAATPATSWPLARYRLAARHLGQAQGQFAVDRPLPDLAWLSRGWLRDYLSQRDSDTALLEDPVAWATPLARRLLPRELATPLLAMRRDRESFLEALERMPHTVCHLDLHPANLFGRDDETVLIDWSFVGVGSLGEDPGNLVPDAVLDFHVPPEEVADLYDLVLLGYLEGLRDAGWAGPEAAVDLAMRATIAAKYPWIAPAMLRAALDQRSTLNRRPIEESFWWWARVVPFLLTCADEGRRLLSGSP
jgi:Phosphotransferase enzyme family